MMDSNFNPNDEFYCMKLNEHVTAMSCKNGIAGKGPVACIDCVTGRERAADILDFKKKKAKSTSKKKASKKSEAIIVESGGDIKIDGIKSEPKMKKCYRCKQYKPLNEFYKNKKTPDGLQWHCKDCTRDYEEEKKRKNFRHKILENEKNIEKAIVVVDFKGHEELLKKLVASAKKNYRLMENEILWMINKVLEGNIQEKT